MIHRDQRATVFITNNSDTPLQHHFNTPGGINSIKHIPRSEKKRKITDLRAPKIKKTKKSKFYLKNPAKGT